MNWKTVWDWTAREQQTEDASSESPSPTTARVHSVSETRFSCLTINSIENKHWNKQSNRWYFPRTHFFWIQRKSYHCHVLIENFILRLCILFGSTTSLSIMNIRSVSFNRGCEYSFWIHRFSQRLDVVGCFGLGCCSNVDDLIESSELHDTSMHQDIGFSFDLEFHLLLFCNQTKSETNEFVSAQQRQRRRRRLPVNTAFRFERFLFLLTTLCVIFQQQQNPTKKNDVNNEKKTRDRRMRAANEANETHAEADEMNDMDEMDKDEKRNDM